MGIEKEKRIRDREEETEKGEKMKESREKRNLERHIYSICMYTDHEYKRQN